MRSRRGRLSPGGQGRVVPVTQRQVAAGDLDLAGLPARNLEALLVDESHFDAGRGEADGKRILVPGIRPAVELAGSGPVGLAHSQRKSHGALGKKVTAKELEVAPEDGVAGEMYRAHVGKE